MRHLLASGDSRGRVVVWDYDRARQILQSEKRDDHSQPKSENLHFWLEELHFGPVVALAWSIDGSLLASADCKEVIVWNLQAASRDPIYRFEKSGCVCLAFRPTGASSELACGSITGEAWIVGCLDRKKRDYDARQSARDNQVCHCRARGSI